MLPIIHYLEPENLALNNVNWMTEYFHSINTIFCLADKMTLSWVIIWLITKPFLPKLGAKFNYSDANCSCLSTLMDFYFGFLFHRIPDELFWLWLDTSWIMVIPYFCLSLKLNFNSTKTKTKWQPFFCFYFLGSWF